MNKEIIKTNLLKSSKFIKYLLSVKDREYFGTPEVTIEDRDLTNEGLFMVMFEIKFETYCDSELSNLIKDLTHVEVSLRTILKDIRINREGNITKNDDENVLRFINASLVNKLGFTAREGKIELELDIMFH